MEPNGSCFAVNVYGHEGEVIKFSAQKDARVKKIKEQISSKTNIPIKNQMLLWDLNPEEKLSPYLDPKKTIHLTQKVVEPSDEELPISLKEADEEKEQPFYNQSSILVSQVKKVNVQPEGQNLMKFTSQKDDRLKKINEQISSKSNVPVENPMLLSGSKVLNPEKKSHSWFDPRTSIYPNQKVMETSDKELQMFLIEADKGKKHTFHVRPSTSVAQLEDLIKAKMTMPPKIQDVSYNGKSLQLGKTLADYLIREFDFFYTTKRCIGG